MIKTFSEAVNYLESLIPKEKQKRYPRELGLLRQKYLLKLLDNPQDKYPCVHVTGTAGKSSTAYLMAAILKEGGYKVGLHISPHLELITERIQINSQNLAKNKFVKILNQIIPAINQVKKSPFGQPTYFEALVALTFLAFAQAKVDIAVIEVGMGGRFDGTNVIKKPLISMITNIGLDHTQILGKTTEQIAHDKKEIIKKNSLVIVGAKQKTVRKIINNKCLVQKSRLYLLNKDFTYQLKTVNEQGSIFNFSSKENHYYDLKLKLLGFHQVENASLALMAMEKLRSCGFKITLKNIKRAFISASFPGRLEIIRKKPLVVFDGAHNQDKMKALTKSFVKLFKYQELIVVLALKKDKDIKLTLAPLLKIASFIIVTRFTIGNDLGLDLSYHPEKLALAIKKECGFKNLAVVSTPLEAFKKALKIQQEKDVILVTGSLYLVGELKTLLFNPPSTFPNTAAPWRQPG